jgi:seryl-tRNA synthetase
MKVLHDQMHSLLTAIPNPSKPDVKVGKDDSENDVIKTVGDKTKFSFTPKDHITLGEQLDIIDIERAFSCSVVFLIVLVLGSSLERNLEEVVWRAHGTKCRLRRSGH